MKLATQARSIETSGTFEQSTAVIECTEAMFTLLADGLYKNKIRAAIRELCCNAADSHTESGNTAPIVVTLPNHLEPYFKVTDQGLGMSHESVMNLYQNFGATTRAGTDEVTGGFGLGSKAPYAYVQTFGVVSCFEGEKRTYVCFRNEKGVPATTLTATEETQEPNGVQVSFRVEAKDFSEFYNEADKVLSAFSQPYLVEGWELDIRVPVVSQEGEGWKVLEARKDQYGYSMHLSAEVRMGNVGYPIPAESLRKLPSDLVALWKNVPIVLEVPVGALVPTPSREDLAVNESMEALLGERLRTIQKALQEGFTQRIEAATSLFEARNIFFAMEKEDSFKLLTNHGRNFIPSWKGKYVERTLNLRLSTTCAEKYTRTEKYVGGQYRPCVTTSTITHFTPHVNDIYVLDNLKGSDFKLKNYVRHETEKERVVLVTAKSKKELKEFLNWLGKGQRECLLASEVDLSDETKARQKAVRLANRAASVKKNVIPSTRRKRGTVRGYRPVLSYRYGDPEKAWAEVQGGVEYRGKSGYYVVIDRWAPVQAFGMRSCALDDFQRALDCLQDYGWVDFELLAVKAADQDKLTKEPGWKHISELAPAVVQQLKNSQEWHDLESLRTSSIHWSSYERSKHPFWEHLDEFRGRNQFEEIKDLASQAEVATTSPLKKAMNTIPYWGARNGVKACLKALDIFEPNQGVLARNPDLMFVASVPELVKSDPFTPLADLCSRYPLLFVVDVPANKKSILEYINLIDSQESNND